MLKNKDKLSLLGSSWSCACGCLHEVPTKLALIEPGAAGRSGEVARFLNLTGRALIIADEITWEIAGHDVDRALKGAGYPTRSFLLPGAKPAATDLTAALASAEVMEGDAFIVSVGSGTVTDISKCAASKQGIPHIAVASAPSMNGYASGIAALTVSGLKMTVQANPPLAVVGDVDILARAPSAMIRAGLGDLVSKPVANADWKLSSIINGERFCPRPFELVQGVDAGDIAKRLAHDEACRAELGWNRDGISLLMEALILSGVSMVIAGSSAPASGGEHLISHFMDMRAEVEGVRHDLHGAQVGVATVATAKLYEKLMSIPAESIDPRALSSAWERGDLMAKRIGDIFGERSGIILAEFAKKRGLRAENEERIFRLAKGWDSIRMQLSPFLVSSARIRAALDLAGAPVHYEEIGQGKAAFEEALVLSLAIRSRFTVLDVALAFGELESWADEIVGA